MSASDFFNSIHHELLDSKLFKFEVILPSVYEQYCSNCDTIVTESINQCPSCSNEHLTRRNRKITVDITAHVALDYDTVERQLHNIPSELAFWAAVYAEAKYRTNLLDRVVKTVRGTVHDEIMQASMKEGVKLTQDSIKLLVEKDERVNRAEGELAFSHMIASKVYYMTEAIRMKADLGRTLTSLKRSEFNGSQQ